MPNIIPTDSTPDLPTIGDEDRIRSDDRLHTTAASLNTFSGAQKGHTPTSSTDIHHESSSRNFSAALSPSLDTSGWHPPPAEGQEDVASMDFASDGSNEVTSEIPEGSSPLAGYVSSNLRRLAEAQQEQPVQRSLSSPITTSIPRVDNSRTVSPTGPLKRECENLRKKQEELQINIDGPSRVPEAADFSRALSMTIVSPLQHVESCIILMHNIANNEEFLKEHVKSLQRKQPHSAFILLRGLHAIEAGNSGYHWADPDGTMDGGFIKTSRVILEEIIRDGLMAKCNFQPRDIVVLGHGQGGMAALAATACWNCIEFGGVVSFGGPMPAYVQLPFNVKAKTPALIYGVARGDITPASLQQIKENFSFTDHHIPPHEHDTVPLTDNELAPLLEFLAHRLGREEWKQQAVISFDGGGIRGYGSLLILRDLMNKIGDEEKRLDRTTDSSFAPWPYKPTTVRSANATGGSANSLPSSDAGSIGPTESHELSNSALFLPCHYFTYAAGTSTGGLISIMLSRFRMTVDDCIKEYETFGKKIFGHPRRMAKGGFPWHRFNARVFEDVIRAVTSTHSMQKDDFENRYGMERTDEDMCQCIVLAYSDHTGGEFPFLFRTYETQAPPSNPNSSRWRQQTFRNFGSAAMLPIWKVARATSAAPGYFPPIKIKTGNGSEVIKFKDGGFGSNNPSEEAYRDIVTKHGGIMHMGPFVSIGTGITKLEMFSRRSDNLSTAIANAKTAIKLPSRTLKAHENMIWHANGFGDEERFPYFRFDGGPKLGEVDLGEWESHHFTRITGKDGTSGRKTLEKIETAIAVFLNDRRVQRELNECAALLVKRRRLRTRNASDWDRYACYSFYSCDIKKCPKRWASTAHDFKEHLRRHHKFKLADPVIDKKVKDCRRVQWLYQ